MAQPQHHGQHQGDGAEARQRELIAHFTTEAQAQQAAQAVTEQAESVRVEPVEVGQFQQEVEGAAAGISIVEIGTLAWVGLALGALIGVIVGTLIYSGQLALPGLAPALSAGPVATAFLAAGIFGSLGWLIGSLFHLFRVPANLPLYEVRVTTAEYTIPDVQQSLNNAGAVDIAEPASEHPDA